MKQKITLQITLKNVDAEDEAVSGAVLRQIVDTALDDAGYVNYEVKTKKIETE